MPLVAGIAVGLGLLLVFEGLTTPRAASSQGRTIALTQLVVPLISSAAAYLLTEWKVLALVGAAVGAGVPRVMSQHRASKQRIELTQALADAAGGLRDAVRGGLGVNDGLASLAVYGPPLLREELATLAAESGRLGVATAASRFAARLEDPGADLLAATLTFNDRVGGKQVTSVLDAMAEELAAEARTLRELRARQARQRTSARVVALAPFALLLVLRHVNPEYLEPYSTSTGQVVLGAASVLIAIGYLVMIRIGRSIEPPRVVVGESA